jgi:hypothetical protein
VPDLLKPFALGKNLTAVSIATITFNSTGTPTVGSAVDILAYINAVQPSLDVEVEDIRPIWNTRPNLVPIAEGEAITISVLARSDDENELTAALRPPTLAKRFRIAYTLAEEGYSGDFTFLGWEHPIQGRGGQLITARFGPTDINTAVQVTLS